MCSNIYTLYLKHTYVIVRWFPNVVDAIAQERKQRVDAVIIYCVWYEFFFSARSYRVNNRCDYYYRSSAKSGDVSIYIYILLRERTRSRLFTRFISISFLLDAFKFRLTANGIIIAIRNIILLCAVKIREYTNITIPLDCYYYFTSFSAGTMLTMTL